MIWFNFFNALIFAVILICLHLSVRCYEDQSDTRSDRTRVAFIFAGSARSFVTPVIKWTIKNNLILSFCPPDLCQGDVFVRVSSSDNSHTGMSASGILSRGTPEFKTLVNSSVMILQPKPESGSLHVQFVDIGSRQEEKEMLEFNNSFKHRVYRSLDPRRYSMYFNRWKAYEQMLNYEKKLNIKYKLVVFARLDAGWGSQIPRFDYWSTDSIHVHETWHIDIPDTFAILPRRASTIYFAMETLFDNQGVICLGGPDFDVQDLEEKYLKRRGFSDKEISIVQNEDCRKISNHVNYDSRTKTNWTTAGMSERILKRRLANHGYVLSSKSHTISLTPLFMFVARYPMAPICYYLEDRRILKVGKLIISGLRPFAGLASACHILTHDIKIYEGWNSQFPQSCLVSTYPFPKDTSALIEATAVDSCLLRKSITDLNFLPFRIRSTSKKQLCLTSSFKPQDQFTKTSFRAIIRMSECVNYRIRSRYTQSYIAEQVFHMYPLISSPQKIRQYDVDLDIMSCLTAIEPDFMTMNGYRFMTSYQHVAIPLEMRPCSLTSNSVFPSSQMFSIIRIERSVFDESSTNDLTYTSPNLKPVSHGILMWTWKCPKTRRKINFCVDLTAKSASDSLVKLSECNTKRYRNRKQDFTSIEYLSVVIEKTSLYDPPYLSGATT